MDNAIAGVSTFVPVDTGLRAGEERHLLNRHMISSASLVNVTAGVPKLRIKMSNGDLFTVLHDIYRVLRELGYE